RPVKPSLFAIWLLVALGACSSQGTPVELTFGDDVVIAAGGAGTGGSGGSTASSTSTSTTTAAGGTMSSAGGEPGVMFGPPMIERFAPSSGPWGTRVTIDGSDLGGASRSASL